jgi:hypothetical protein
MKCSYKTLTCVLTVVLVALFAAIGAAAVVVYNNKFFMARVLFTRSFQQALRTATSNNVLCGGARGPKAQGGATDRPCHRQHGRGEFEADLAVLPPSSLPDAFDRPPSDGSTVATTSRGVKHGRQHDHEEAREEPARRCGGGGGATATGLDDTTNFRPGGDGDIRNPHDGGGGERAYCAAAPVPAAAAAPAGSDLYFSLAAAKFAAQVVAILEKAASQHVEPTPRHDTALLCLLSGTDRVKTHNIGWVLKVQESETRDQIWVAFRGTQTKAEWQQDFKMSQVELVPWTETAAATPPRSCDPVRGTPTTSTPPPPPPTTTSPSAAPPASPARHPPTMLVHQGFLEIYNEIRAELLKTLNEHVVTPPPGATPPRVTTLYITGHSLGAAIAVLCLVDLLVLSPPALACQFTDVRCYLFGAPRVGNKVFVDAVRRLFATRAQLKEFYVIANDDDIVPNIPLAVQPNLDTPDLPWFYAQFPLKRFSTNWGSWTHNHTLPVHISYLNQLGNEQ